MDKAELYSKVYEVGVFIDNTYFSKYIDLVYNNISTCRRLFITQKHHIIPVSYFKYKKLPVDNSPMNVVNLLYKDHLLAHYYLFLCMKGIYRYKMSLAFSHLLGNVKNNKNHSAEDIESFVSNLEHYQEIYSIRCEYLSKIRKGKKRSRESEEKRIKTRMERGSGKHSESTKKLISEKLKGKNNHRGDVWMNNGTKSSLVKKSKIDYMISRGYLFGRLKLNISEEGMANRRANGKKSGSLPKSDITRAKIRRALINRRKKENI